MGSSQYKAPKPGSQNNRALTGETEYEEMLVEKLVKEFEEKHGRPATYSDKEKIIDKVRHPLRIGAVERGISNLMEC